MRKDTSSKRLFGQTCEKKDARRGDRNQTFYKHVRRGYTKYIADNRLERELAKTCKSLKRSRKKRVKNRRSFPHILLSSLDLLFHSLVSQLTMFPPFRLPQDLEIKFMVCMRLYFVILGYFLPFLSASFICPSVCLSFLSRRRVFPFSQTQFKRLQSSNVDEEAGPTNQPRIQTIQTTSSKDNRRSRKDIEKVTVYAKVSGKLRLEWKSERRGE